MWKIINIQFKIFDFLEQSTLLKPSQTTECGSWIPFQTHLLPIFPFLFTFQAFLNVPSCHFSSNMCFLSRSKNALVPVLGLADPYGSSTFQFRCCFWNAFPEYFMPQRQVQVSVLCTPVAPSIPFSQLLLFNASVTCTYLLPLYFLMQPSVLSVGASHRPPPNAPQWHVK